MVHVMCLRLAISALIHPHVHIPSPSTYHRAPSLTSQTLNCNRCSVPLWHRAFSIPRTSISSSIPNAKHHGTFVRMTVSTPDCSTMPSSNATSALPNRYVVRYPRLGSVSWYAAAARAITSQLAKSTEGEGDLIMSGT
jgi:hypothetical protein